METSTAVVSRAGRTLDLRNLMDDLLKDQRVSSADHAQLLNSSRSKEEAMQHPLTYIAEKSLPDIKRAGARLDIDVLMQWLSEQSGQALFHLDPLKVNVPAITEVMSFEFAKRHNILAVQVSVDEVTIASAEPYLDSWQSNLEHVLRRPIKRVLIDPADLQRYTVEFYSLAKSVRGASGASGQATAGVANFEQLLELGDMKDPMPMISTSLILWIGFYNTLLISGPVIFILNRVVKWVMCVFVLMACCTTLMNFPLRWQWQ